MYQTKFIRQTAVALGILILAAGVFVAADHIDAPAVSGTTSDIADLYTFRSPDNPDNLVFVATIQGLMDPAATSMASFNPDQMLEFNIDNNGDNIEDLVIQCLYLGDELFVYGPAAPSSPGTQSRVNVNANLARTEVTEYQQNPMIGESGGVRVYAGPRDDPFFFDFNQYQTILAGNASGFSDPGSDTFAGTNVLATVVEVPKSMLGGTGTINVWVESKLKQ